MPVISIGRREHYLLFRVEFDNELFVDVLRNVGTLGIVEEFTREVGAIPLKPRIVACTRSQIIGNNFQRLGTLTDGDNITHPKFVRRDVDNIAIDSNVAMGDKLTCLGTAASDTKTVDDIVKTSLNEFHEFLTSDTTATGGFSIEFTELALKDAVSIFCFLLLLKLNAIFGHFATATVLTVHTRGIRFLFIVLVGTINGLVELSCYFGFRTCISCHCLQF